MKDLKSVKQDEKRKYRLFAGLAAILIIAAFTGTLLAKYITSNKQRAEMIADDFHSSSDYLEEDEKTYTVSDWRTNGICIELYNYEKENVALISGTEINYTISVPAGWNVKVENITDTGGEQVLGKDNVYTMPKSTGRIKQILTFTYTGSGEPSDGNIQVNVKSTSPYVKELKAAFELTGDQGLTYAVTDEGDYDVVTIESNAYQGTVNVSWDGTKLSPDNTNEYMSEWQNSTDGSSDQFEVKAFTTYQLIFLEDCSGNYSKADITVEIGG